MLSQLPGCGSPHLAPPLPRSLQISTQGDSRVRYVSPLGIISTVAGNGVGALNGDGGRATSASLWNPSISPYDDGIGGWLISDSNNRVVRPALGGGLRI